MNAVKSQQRDRRVAEAVAVLEARLTAADADPIVRFLKRLYERVPPEDLEALPTQTLYGAAVALWRLAEQRRPGTARVRVYNPDVAEHGWSSPHTVIEIVNDDMPFLVDSVAAELERRGLTIHLIIHPVVVVRRDGSGRRIALLEGRPAGEGIAESLMHVQVDALSQQAALDDLREGILKVLGDVRVAIADWQPMLAKLNESVARLEAVPPPVPAEEVEEVKAFLRWLADNHFTFLGYREHAFTAGEPPLSSAVVGSELGILRDAHAALFTGAETPDELRAEARYFIESPEPIVVAKTTARAPVHRPVPMDYLGIKHYDRQGRVVGEARFVGLFTSAAYNRTPRDIPYLRRKIARALSSTGFDPLGHDGKALVNVLETYPRDELFQIAEDELFNTAMGILRLQERPRIRLFVRADRYERFCSCLVFIPREQYTGALRHRVEGLLATAFCGRVAAFYTQLGDSSLARLHLIIATTPGAVPRPDLARLEQQIVAAARSWDEDLHEALIERWGEETGNRMRVRYDGAFPSAYRERFSGCEAVRDIELCEIVAAPGEIAVAMYRPLEAAEHSARFKIYHARDPIALSDCLPMLENMGLRVIEEVPFRIARNGNQLPLYVQDFLLNEAHGRAFDPGPIRREFEETFGRVWRGEIENDGFNRLVAWARLTWREVVILRAYCKYLLQTKIPFSQAYMEETLARHPGIARLLIALYHARFDPARVGEGGRAATAAGTAIEEALEQVQSADEDRMLRRFLEIVRATTRTNYYQTGRDGRPKPYLSFKLDPHALTELPPPRPFAEIFVYSPRVEGVHLRGGKVARGGIRWSDRREDFRTEVLGLMKAQMVKNAVIVPVGAKGGFVPKRLPTGGDREATLAEVVACYGTLIRGLLDLTDNLTGATVIKPVQTVCHDDDDPYLVVAADKGTATFSDIANTIAKEYRHWLGDAFASGGSHGYDHKKMAITALGVWEGVKRHFRELGVNAETAVITAVGIGDMAGDVFGNGLLLSPHLKLVAAFNHMHIFCDPNPDPARSFAERRRLFELPRSTWAQYDENVLSPGGRVFNRASKSLDLTSEIKASLGLDRDRMAPAELILAILMAPVDLLWVGGIGTYVKAAQESNAEVDDRANDALRINGKELRCRVVGEGGNLGFTQRGRIEYAAAGGRLNTDAIDNSGGVDSSDHEVNIKIVLDAVVAEGDLTEKQRNRLLDDMAEEVAALVLRDNYLQTQAISVAQAGGRDFLEVAVRLMRTLERGGQLDRALEFLPSEEEVAERRAAGRGLTRPEIAVLLSYSKMALYDALLASDVPEDSYLGHDLQRYFPARLQEAFAGPIREHQLRREIITTFIANSIVNRAGPTFVSELAEDTGRSESDIARAYTVARDAFRLRELWTAIEALDNTVASEVQARMLRASAGLLRHATMWYLRYAPQPIDIAATIKVYANGVARLIDAHETVLAPFEAEVLHARAADLVAAGVPERLALWVAGLDSLGAANDIVFAAIASGRAVEEVGRVYFALGAHLGLDWLRASANAMPAEDYWARLATAAIVEDLLSQQRALTTRVLATANGHAGDAVVEAWAQRNQDTVHRTSEMIAEFKAIGGVDMARLAVANRHLRSVIISQEGA